MFISNLIKILTMSKKIVSNRKLIKMNKKSKLIKMNKKSNLEKKDNQFFLIIQMAIYLTIFLKMNKIKKSSKNQPENRQISKNGKMKIKRLKLKNKIKKRNKTTKIIKNKKSSKMEMKITNKIKIGTINNIKKTINNTSKTKQIKKESKNKIFLNKIILILKKMKLTKNKKFKKIKKYIKKKAIKFFIN